MSGDIRASEVGPGEIGPGEIGPSEIGEILVVIPANDEGELIGDCLASVDRARERLAAESGAPGVRVIVVLDACVDGTAAVAGGWPGIDTLVVMFRSVGRSRDHGVRHGIKASTSSDASQIWIACTDADSQVPVDWLTSQLALADGGADAVLGAVAPSAADLSDERYAAWALRSESDDEEHVHGANLGVRADRYLAAGGFPHLAEHEDSVLVERLRARGAAVVAGGSRVITSARAVGRTPGGYAEFVRANY